MYGKVAAAVSGWSLVAIVGMTSLFGLSYTVLQQNTEAFRVRARGQVAEVTRDMARNVDYELEKLELFADRLGRAATVPNVLDPVTVGKAEDVLEGLLPETGRVSIDMAPDVLSPAGVPEGQATTQAPDAGRAAGPDSRFVDDLTLLGPTDADGSAQDFVIRYPIHSDPENGTPARLVGTISVRIPASYFLEAPAVSSPLTEPLSLAIRVIGPEGEQVFGPAVVRTMDPLIEDIDFTNGQWAIMAVPQGGWPMVSPKFGRTLTLVIMLTLATAVGIGGTHYLVYHKYRSHKLLSNAVEAVDAGFVLYDENDRLVVSNAKFADQFGALKGAVQRGATYESLIRIADESWQKQSTEAGADWFEQRLAGHARGQEFVINRPDGTWAKVSETRTADGFSVSIITDITVQKQAQLAAEAASRQKTEFLSTVTHELRTPLTVIGGYAQILSQPALLTERTEFLRKLKAQETVQSGLLRSAAAYDETVISYGNKIGGWADHMLKLVNDLLDWAQLERDSTKLVRECVDVPKLVDALVQDMRPQAEAKGLTLTADHVDGFVMADHHRLNQVLMNIVGNAIKFTAEGSVRIEAFCENDRLVLSVEDTGVGIPEEDLDRIFERFQQVDNSSTRSFGGFGLGLSIASRIVELHDGTISVTSGPGRGTRFTLELPEAAPGSGMVGHSTARTRAG